MRLETPHEPTNLQCSQTYGEKEEDKSNNYHQEKKDNRGYETGEQERAHSSQHFFAEKERKHAEQFAIVQTSFDK